VWIWRALKCQMPWNFINSCLERAGFVAKTLISTATLLHLRQGGLIIAIRESFECLDLKAVCGIFISPAEAKTPSLYDLERVSWLTETLEVTFLEMLFYSHMAPCVQVIWGGENCFDCSLFQFWTEWPYFPMEHSAVLKARNHRHI